MKYISFSKYLLHLFHAMVSFILQYTNTIAFIFFFFRIQLDSYFSDKIEFVFFSRIEILTVFFRAHRIVRLHSRGGVEITHNKIKGIEL